MQISKILTNAPSNSLNYSSQKNITTPIIKDQSEVMMNSLNSLGATNRALVFKGKAEIIAEEYYENGNKKFEKYSNGAERSWWENGQVKLIKKAGGSYTEFYENGKTKHSQTPDGTICEWFENGQKSKMETKDGTIETWYENGQQYSLQTKHGAIVIWKANGDLAVVKSSNGTLDTWGQGKRQTTHIVEKNIADTPIDNKEN